MLFTNSRIQEGSKEGRKEEGVRNPLYFPGSTEKGRIFPELSKAGRGQEARPLALAGAAKGEGREADMHSRVSTRERVNRVRFHTVRNQDVLVKDFAHVQLTVSILLLQLHQAA